jgi:outer membrane murein-binding lipoprotein Lpp
MKGTMKACAMTVSAAAVTAATLAGCSTGNGSNPLASHSTTVEYYRVFDIKTDVPAPSVAKAATDGINRNVKDAVVAAPPGVEATELPGHFKIADPTSAPPGAPVAKGPSCDGAAWTAKATPRVRGTEDMNLVACLFPYKSGYHLDMYAVFTKPEGGIMQWPRRLSGAFLGTPEKFTESAMMDVVRAIRESTGANVSLVEAKPNLAGTPWLEPGTKTAQANTGNGGGSATAGSTGGTGSSAAAGEATAAQPGSAAGASKPNSVPE